MAVTRNLTQVTWSALNSQSVSSGGNATSDVVNIDATAISADLMIKVDRTGTPVSGDVTTLKVLYSSGDPDAEADSADEYDTVQHALPITVDNFAPNGEDPAIVSIPIKVGPKSFKLYASNGGAGAVVVSAQLAEKRVS